MPAVIDTHAHLYNTVFDPDREAVLARARAAGFTRVINIGTDLTTSRQAVEMARAHPGFLYATVGLHPTDTALSEGDLAACLEGLEQLATENRNVVRAIGEIGLDYYWDRSPPDAQQRAFRAQLALAARLDLPVVIHCREALADTLAMVAEHAPELRGVFHCFGGEARDAERAVELGWHVSFAGNVTYPKAVALREAASAVPVERLLLETDAPFLAPQPVRGKRCEPAHALHTLAALASLRGLPAEALAELTTRSAEQLFGLE